MYQPLQSASSLPSEQSATPLHLASDLTHWPSLQANKPSGQDGGNVPKWKKKTHHLSISLKPTVTVAAERICLS